MINKTEAIRTGKFLQLQFLSAAISAMNAGNKENGIKDTYMIVAKEIDTDPQIVSADFLLSVKVFCNSIPIFAKEKTYSKVINKDKLQSDVAYSFSATVIMNAIQSGLVNWKLSNDALVEQGAQIAPGMDRVSLIDKIRKFPPNLKAGTESGFSFSFEGDVAGSKGSWDFESLLFEATYEQLIKLYNGVKLESSGQV